MPPLDALFPFERVVQLGEWTVADSPIVRLAQRTEHFDLAERVKGRLGPFATAVMIDGDPWL